MKVIWLTGLSSAGKTTIANDLYFKYGLSNKQRERIAKENQELLNKQN